MSVLSILLMEDSSMTDTIQAPADTATDEATEAVQAEEFAYLDPAAIIIGTNVRADLRPTAPGWRSYASWLRASCAWWT